MPTSSLIEERFDEDTFIFVFDSITNHSTLLRTIEGATSHIELLREDSALIRLKMRHFTGTCLVHDCGFIIYRCCCCLFILCYTFIKQG